MASDTGGERICGISLICERLFTAQCGRPAACCPDSDVCGSGVPLAAQRVRQFYSIISQDFYSDIILSSRRRNDGGLRRRGGDARRCAGGMMLVVLQRTTSLRARAAAIFSLTTAAPTLLTFSTAGRWRSHLFWLATASGIALPATVTANKCCWRLFFSWFDRGIA